MTALALLFFILPGFGQSQIQSLADLDRENASIASKIKQIRGIEGKTLGISQFPSENLLSPLGKYWRENLINLLAATGLRIISGSAPVEYEIGGEIVDLGETVRIFTRLIDKANSAVTMAWTTDLVKTPYLAGLLVYPEGAPVARDAYEDDTNNPVELTVNTLIARTLGENDTDWFFISPTENMRAAVETHGSVDTMMELYGGSVFLRRDDDGGEAENAKITWYFEAGKTYTIMVMGYSRDTTGAYTISCTPFEETDKALEPNNAMGTASPISIGDIVPAFLFAGDEDWYSFNLPANQRIYISTTGNMDTHLTLYNSQGIELAQDDDSGADSNARIIGSLEPGLYYVRVREYEGREEGDYTLSTSSRIEKNIDSYENDDIQTQAKEITLGEIQQRNFTDSDDTDWVFFTIVSPGVYQIRAYGESSLELDTFIGLYDEHQSLIIEDDDGGQGYSSLLRRQLYPGRYYIKVECLDDDPEGNYLLSVTQG
jgi:hypothetical protein